MSIHIRKLNPHNNVKYNYDVANQNFTNLAEVVGSGISGDGGATIIYGVTGLQGARGFTGINGLTGIQGETGLQGIRGITGVGSTGSQGDTGGQGLRGMTGVKGDTGTQGLTGPPGAPQGFTGLDGATGLRGVTGLQGETGSQGLRGLTGIKGDTGTIGPTGPAGAPQGVTGVAGTAGSQGVTGLRGVTGFIGGTGLRGPTGISGAPWVNAADFGIVGDYSGDVTNGSGTDNTTFIQNALDSLPVYTNGQSLGSNTPLITIKSGGTVYLPNGNYLITRPLLLPPSVTLKGAGSGSIITARLAGYTNATRHGAIEFKPAVDGGGGCCSTTWANIEDLVIGTDVCHGITVPPPSEFTGVYYYDSNTGQYHDYTSMAGTEKARRYFEDTDPPVVGTDVFKIFEDISDELVLGRDTKFYAFWWDLYKRAILDTPWRTPIHDMFYSTGFGTWQQFTPTSTLGGNFRLRWGGTDITGLASATDWAATRLSDDGTPSGSAFGPTAYWIRVKPHDPGSAGSPDTYTEWPVGHQITTWGSGLNSCRIKNVQIAANNWAMFFPATRTYLQNCLIDNVLSYGGGGGILWAHGNANQYRHLNSEGGLRTTTYNGGHIAQPAMVVLSGLGAVIADTIIEGSGPQADGYAPRGYYLAVSGLNTHNLWFEMSGIPRENISTIVEDASYTNLDGPPTGRLLIDRSSQVTIGVAQIGFTADIGDQISVIDGSYTIDSVSGYYDVGMLGERRHHFNRATPISHSLGDHGNITNPDIGNLVINGDFANGVYNWFYEDSQSALTTKFRPDGMGKRLCVTVPVLSTVTFLKYGADNNAGNPNPVNLRSDLTGSPGFIGFGIEICGNLNILHIPTTTVHRGRTVVPLESITTDRPLWVVAGGDPNYSAIYVLSGTTWTDRTVVSTTVGSPYALWPTASSMAYFGSGLSPREMSVVVSSPSSGLELIVEYWNGYEWTAVANLVDGTSNLTVSGTITFTCGEHDGTTVYTGINPSTSSDWDKRWVYQSGDMYWLRIRCNVNGSFISPMIDTITIPKKGKFYISDVYMTLGNCHNVTTNSFNSFRWTSTGNVHFQAASQPSGSFWIAGDIAWNSAPANGGSIGWVYTSGNVWKTFGAITA